MEYNALGHISRISFKTTIMGKKYSLLEILGRYLENTGGRPDFFQLHLLVQFYILDSIVTIRSW